MRNKTAAVLLAAMFFCRPVLAETLLVADEERAAPVFVEATPAATAAIKPAATPAPRPAVKPAAEPTKSSVAMTLQPADVSAVTAKVEAVKTTVEELRAKGDSLDEQMRELREDLKIVEERSLEIKEIVRDVDVFKTRVTELEQQYTKSKEETQKYLGDFDRIKNSLRENMDGMQGYNDILEVLKKEINNNELEIAKIKKTMNEVKNKYGDEDNFFTALCKWPYLGITALGLSVIAVGVAAAR
ncbi:MAG: hypothetical protein LLG37_00605 [Spirochaetia bacterium]|nr:hypothetical protein [Spirochaetia bacterium]